MRAPRLPADVPERFWRTVIAGCLSAAAFTVASTALPAGSAADSLVDRALLVAGAVTAIVAALGATRRAEGRDAQAWWLITASLVCWAAGSCDYGVRWLLGGGTSYASIDAELCYALALPAAFAGFVRFSRQRRVLSTRVRRVLDLLTVVSSAAFVTWDLSLRVIIDHPRASGVAWGMLLYPIGDLVLISLAVLVATTAPSEHRRSLALVACGVAAFTVSGTTNATLRALGAYQRGTVSDVGWIVGCFTVALAARCFSFRNDEPSGRAERSAAWRSAFLPYALVVPAAAVVIADGILEREPDLLAIVLGVLVAVFVVSRQILTIIENMRLVQQLTGRESELRSQALHDVLTGLANRRLFRETLEAALEAQPPDEVAVVFVDLDDFKVVNDTMGHATGDELLLKVANRLAACVRGSDLAARLGGDEFAVLLTSGGLSAAQSVAGRLTRAMRQPILCGGQPLFIQASVGIAAGGDESGRDSQQLLEQADMAMYAAKDAGKARLAVFEPAMRERLLDRAAVKDDLARALGRGQLLLHYQPIVDLASARIVGAEALLRWRHPQRGFIPPNLFIPLAEETGLIAPIGRWVLQQACREAAAWQCWAPSAGFEINVNVSAGQLLNTDIVDEVRAVLADAQLAARLLTVEITESVLMADNDTVAAQLAALKTLGIELAIDDFGTGYSGLSYLDRLPVDGLKVDKAFVDRLDEPSTRAPLAGAIVGLAELLGLDVVAEGIETPTQRAALVEMGCARGQGYHFSRPVTTDKIRDLLATGPALAEPLRSAAPRALTRSAAAPAPARAARSPR